MACEADPDVLAGQFLVPGKVVLLAGQPGSGKSTLAGRLADVLEARAEPVFGLCADTGSPAWGPPGAVSLAERADGAWKVVDSEGIGSLDAGRFRLPLVSAVTKLVRRAEISGAPLVVDAPGLHRGVTAAEALAALVDAVGADTVLMLHEAGEEPEVAGALSATAATIVSVASHPKATSPTKSARARARTATWDAYLEGAGVLSVPLSVPRLTLAGSPEVGPLGQPDAWLGRQVVLLDAQGDTLALGEVESAATSHLEIRAPLGDTSGLAHLLVRDARRNERGQLRTNSKKSGKQSVRLKPHFSGRKPGIVEVEPGGAMSVRIGFADFTLLGGIFGDPTVHVRVQHQRRRILFDLGSAGQLPPKVLHRVSDVFISHAHFDHFAGFVDLLRRWVHSDGVCRVWGPPGLADQVESMTRAFTWDRIGRGEGPVFVVGEFDGQTLRKTRIEAAVAGGRVELSEEPVEDGLLLREPRFRVRACSLEHGTTVLAYALEESSNYAVRSDLLEGRYEPGPWLGELKYAAAAGHLEQAVELPGGTTEPVGELAERLLIEKPGEKIVYATDFADTQPNRESIVDLARDAAVLICEAAYRRDDAEIAALSRHLTTTACAEIARDAGVGRLIPFHFSSRYEASPEALYAEIVEVFPDVVVPKAITLS